MARLTEHEAAHLAWEFVRQNLSWWRRRRIENRPRVRLVTHEEFAQIDCEAPTTWFVSFPRNIPHVDMDPDPSTATVSVDDLSGACEWVMKL
jgi:hypothetical protein